MLGDIIWGHLAGRIDGADKRKQEPEKDNDQDNFEKQDIKMAHHPPGKVAVPLPDFVHKILKRHNFLQGMISS